jgi:ATP-dependent RNA helicase DDX60
MLQALLAAHGTDYPSHIKLIYIFAVHAAILPHLPLSLRAQPLVKIEEELSKDLIEDFLPLTFDALAELCIRRKVAIDIDGRVFIALLRLMTSSKGISLADAFGPETYAKLNAHWEEACMPTVDLSTLAMCSKAPDDDGIKPISRLSQQGLLTFSHPVFNDAMHTVQVTVSDEEALTLDTIDERMYFGRDTIFNDDRHWHNHKRHILPKHLGGEDFQPTDDLQRKRKLRRDQRFMAGMDKHAHTLTGALGTPLSRIVIIANSKGNKHTKAVSGTLQVSRSCYKNYYVLIKVDPGCTEAKCQG